jgi:hypothetical protein
MTTITGVITMTATDLAQLPVYLRSYENLNNHIRDTIEDLDSTAKGRAFARFASRIIPLELGDRFTRVELGVDGPDGGVDLFSTSADGRYILYGQSKLTIKKSEDIELIISKFHDYYQRVHTNIVGQRYIAEIDNLPRNPEPKKPARPSRSRSKKSNVVVIDTNDDVPVECIFVIATLSKIDGKVAEYEKSSYTGRRYYDELKQAGRLIILDGTKLFPQAQAAYRKSNILPSNITLELVGNYIHQDNVYIGVVSAKELKRCYKDYGESLFLDNIRLFLGYSNKKDRDNVNSSILETAEKYPREMLARNNGITFRADTISPVNNTDNKLYLTRASIVNGCQTTKCIVDAMDDTAYILVKLVATDAAWSIAKTANSQTKVDQIVLELAKYIRPQAVKKAASNAGYIVEDLHESIYDVFNSIYRDEVIYDEIFYLFVGLFSREPKNVINMNYTEVRREFLNQLQGRDPSGDETLLLLFRLFAIGKEGKEEAERTYQDEYSKVYERFWKDDKADYRSVLTVLAACGAVRMNIYKPDNQPAMSIFFDKLDALITNDREKYIRFYCYAYEAVVTYLSNKRQTDETTEKQRYMYDDLRTAPFDIPYNNMCMISERSEKLYNRILPAQTL